MKENDRIGNRTEYLLARLPIGKVSQEIESLLHVVAKIYTHWLLFNLALVLIHSSVLVCLFVCPRF